MKVLFFYSVGHTVARRRPLRTMDQIQFGISYISALLKEHGHEVDLLAVSSYGGKNNSALVKKRIEAFKPDVVGFYAVASEFAYVKSVAEYIRSIAPECFLLIGGPHATMCPEEVMAGPFDALCVGEGEYPTLELLEQLSQGRKPSGIANLWIRHGDEMERNAARGFLENLDGLPMPDRSLWLKYVDAPVSMPSVLLGRGCDFSCTYCSNHVLKKAAPGRYVRRRSPESIAAEVKELAEKHRFPQENMLYFEVETFIPDLDWALSVCRKLKEIRGSLRKPLRYGVNIRVRPNMQTDELFAAMVEAGFAYVNVGIESGSDRVRREVLNRTYSNDDILRIVRSARRHGLQVNCFNMIGLPGETYEEHLETVEINRRCQPDRHFTGIFFPYPGTELYRRCQAMGMPMELITGARERQQPVFSYERFSAEQIQHADAMFNYRVYRGHKSLLFNLLPRVIDKKIPWLRKKVAFSLLKAGESLKKACFLG